MQMLKQFQVVLANQRPEQETSVFCNEVDDVICWPRLYCEHVQIYSEAEIELLSNLWHNEPVLWLIQQQCIVIIYMQEKRKTAVTVWRISEWLRDTEYTYNFRGLRVYPTRSILDPLHQGKWEKPGE